MGRAARLGRPPDGPRPRHRYEWFGGDLPGIEAHLDHIESARRERHLPDPVLPGGHHAPLRRDDVRPRRPAARRRRGARLADAAAHARGMRVIGDLTHEPHRRQARVVQSRASGRRRSSATSSTSTTRFRRLRGVVGRPDAPQAELALPELRGGSTAVAQKWLQPPYSLDGWRVDVANMTGRYAATTSTTRSRGDRDARSRRAESLVVAEHATTTAPTSARLARAMNYAGSRARPGPGCAATSERSVQFGPSGRVPRLDGTPGGDDARVSRRRAVGVDAPLVGAARQPRQSPAFGPSRAREAGSSSVSA